VYVPHLVCHGCGATRCDGRRPQRPDSSDSRCWGR
jgi:hypothetical protein